jgi:hypothetical protein
MNFQKSRIKKSKKNKKKMFSEYNDNQLRIKGIK